MTAIQRAPLLVAAVALGLSISVVEAGTPRLKPAYKYAVTPSQYSLKDKDLLDRACNDEFGMGAHVLDLDADIVNNHKNKDAASLDVSLKWKSFAPLFSGESDEMGLKRYHHYWAQASPEYLAQEYQSHGIVLEYLVPGHDHEQPVLLGDAAMPSFMKVQVLCKILLKSEDDANRDNVIVPENDPVLTASSFGHFHVETWGGDEEITFGKPNLKRMGPDAKRYHLAQHPDSATTSLCDFILVDHPDFMNGLGLQIHVRTKTTPLWSFISAVAVKIGDDVLEVEGSKNGKKGKSAAAEHNPYWVNGIFQKNLDGLFSESFLVVSKQLNPRQRDFSIDFGYGDMISIRTFQQYVRVDLQTTPSSGVLEGAFGLMGSFPNGEKIGSDYQTMFHDVSQFAREWEAYQEDRPSLFHAASSSTTPAAPQHQKCNFEVTSSAHKNLAVRSTESDPLSHGSVRRRLSESEGSVISQEEAEEACRRVHSRDSGKLEACIKGLVALAKDSSAGDDMEDKDDVSGAFADVYHVLFQTDQD